jgi:hypothetical protein
VVYFKKVLSHLVKGGCVVKTNEEFSVREYFKSFFVGFFASAVWHNSFLSVIVSIMFALGELMVALRIGRATDDAFFGWIGFIGWGIIVCVLIEKARKFYKNHPSLEHFTGQFFKDQ